MGEGQVYLCSSCAGSCLDIAMVVLVGRCSISIKQRGVFCIWYICRRKPFSLVLCSYVLYLSLIMVGGVFVSIFLW